MSLCWCFTVNNPTTVQLAWTDQVKYAVWQKESGEAGTVHLQGYVEFTCVKRLPGVKKIIPGAHWETRRGTQHQARAYCMKDDTRLDGPWEHGTFVESHQGRRTDIERACQTLTETRDLKRVAELHPCSFVKYHRGFEALSRMLDDNKLPVDVTFVPRAWQQYVLDLVDAPSDDRHIMWVTDTVGNRGKSRLARFLVSNHGAVILEGRLQDMAYQYAKEPVVIFDITRAQAEQSDHLYSFAEKLKNGMVNSTKYETIVKVFDPPHVIFFSNGSWSREKWSNDRVIEVDLNSPAISINRPYM